MSTPEYEELETDFGEVMAILRGGVPELSAERPSEAIWDAIASELGPTVAGPLRPPSVLPDPTEEAIRESSGLAEVRSITSARSWARPLAMVAGAAAVLLVAIPLALAVTGGSDASQRAELAALDGFEGAAEAEVSGDTLTVRFDGVEAPIGSFYELWLLDAEEDDVRDLRSLGQIEVAADGSFVIPDDVDISEFDVVDISIEPDDGNPEHSGASVLRGGLTDV